MKFVKTFHSSDDDDVLAIFLKIHINMRNCKIIDSVVDIIMDLLKLFLISSVSILGVFSLTFEETFEKYKVKMSFFEILFIFGLLFYYQQEFEELESFSENIDEWNSVERIIEEYNKTTEEAWRDHKLRFMLQFDDEEDAQRFSIFGEKVLILLEKLTMSEIEEDDHDYLFIQVFDLHLTKDESEGQIPLNANETFKKLYKKYKELKEIEDLTKFMEEWVDIEKLIKKYERSAEEAWEIHKMENGLVYTSPEQEARDFEKFKHIIKKILKKLKKVLKKIKHKIGGILGGIGDDDY